MRDAQFESDTHFPLRAKGSSPLLALAFTLLFSAIACATETWLFALGEREEDPEWGVFRIVAPNGWEELKDGAGGLTTHGMITMYMPPMFGDARVTLAPIIADRARAENSAMKFRVNPRKFHDLLEILLSEFDVLDSKPRFVATVQILLTSAPFGSSGPAEMISTPGCARLAVVKGGRKLTFVKLMRTLRARSIKRTGETMPKCVTDDASDGSIAAYWRNTLLKGISDEIETVQCNSIRGFMIFELKDGAGENFQSALRSLNATFF